MARDDIEWVAITGLGNKKIGAVGFSGGKAIATIAFYEDYDGDMDGDVSWGEWLAAKMSPIGLDGYALVQVMMAAKHNMDVLRRDATYAQEADRAFLSFANGLIKDGVYAAYFSIPVKMTGAGIAGQITQSAIKGFAIRKGFETAAKKAFQEAVER